MDDFLKSVRTPQEAIEIYQKVREILSKGGFNLTKWITSDDEVKTQIQEADRSTKVVKTFEAKTQSSSILRLNWNVDTDNLIACRRSEQEVHAKITHRNVLSFVSAVFDPLEISSSFTLRMRFPLKSIWAAMGQAWDKELSPEHSKGPLKADEIHQSEQKLFRFIQNESFPTVSKPIANSKEMSKLLNIAKLSPFIEEDGTIRVKGPLKHTNLDCNAKHPILLTAKHPVVQLLLERAQRDNLHEGTEYVRNML